MRCRKPFAVADGTVSERSHVPLHQWEQAITLLICFKKGISSHQLHHVFRVS